MLEGSFIVVQRYNHKFQLFGKINYYLEEKSPIIQAVVEDYTGQKHNPQEFHSYISSRTNFEKDSITDPLKFIQPVRYFYTTRNLIEEKGTYGFADTNVNCNVYEFSNQDTSSKTKVKLEGFAMYAKEVGWCYTEYTYGNQTGIYELGEILTFEEIEILKSEANNTKSITK